MLIQRAIEERGTVFEGAREASCALRDCDVSGSAVEVGGVVEEEGGETSRSSAFCIEP